MDVNAETARKLREMGAAELLAALSAQDEAVCAGMAFAERVQMAVDEAHSDFITQKVRNLTRRAGLRYPETDVRSVDFFEGHGLDRILHPVQEEGLAPEARRRGACRRHHGQDRAQRGLGRHGRGQHAAAPRIDR